MGACRRCAMLVIAALTLVQPALFMLTHAEPPIQSPGSDLAAVQDAFPLDTRIGVPRARFREIVDPVVEPC